MHHNFTFSRTLQITIKQKKKETKCSTVETFGMLEKYDLHIALERRTVEYLYTKISWLLFLKQAIESLNLEKCFSDAEIVS